MDAEHVEVKPTPPKRKNLLIYILAVVLAAMLAAVVGYLLTRSDDPDTSPTPIITLKKPLVRPDLVATGLSQPTAIVSTPDPGDRRLFVVEQAGVIRIINASGQLETAPFLDISTQTLLGDEMGLLGLVFDPSYKKNGYFYINYIDKSQNTVIARYQVSAQSNTANPTSAKVLFTLKQPYQNHNGGDLAFGPDGFLYIALGDGGNAGDPENRAQDTTSYFGKILRLDVHGGDPYAVPSTNPFVKVTGAKPEIWAYGLRNPWRISFDKTTGDLYIADVGQGELEELDVQKSSSKGGENYGWRCYEGKQTFRPEGCKSASEFVPPVIEYNHDQNRCSITGGYVYRGSQYPALIGKYFYGDYCSGQLFYAENRNNTWTNTLVSATPYQISTFGQGSDGELYFADFKTGSMYHLQDTANR